jgi:hypothetical protein
MEAPPLLGNAATGEAVIGVAREALTTDITTNARSGIDLGRENGETEQQGQDDR